jgi:uncharacterized protein YxjI
MDSPPALDSAFDRDTFLLRQKHLAIREKYYVWDEKGDEILYMERPRHMARNLAAAFGAVVAGVVFLIVAVPFVDRIPRGGVQDTFGVLSFVGFFVIVIVVGTVLSKKRHLTIYRDDTKREVLLEILQDRKFQPITATYTVLTPEGEVLAALRKNYLYNAFRKRWYCDDPAGDPICMAMEDSLLKSLLRRFLGPLFGVLRTNFVIIDPKGGPRGRLDREFTILDRYVLNMEEDRERWIDRRVALALGVMMDTGERR